MSRSAMSDSVSESAKRKMNKDFFILFFIVEERKKITKKITKRSLSVFESSHNYAIDVA